ncbi:IS66 family transposase, partial [Corallococcus exiguus]|uniref:IS66 family transposase n=1 Tax=Corallococcus exiguus TaxID=83462 RepID=UPI0015601E44|nr:transposase [Corallococcus exiguus]
MPLHRLAQRVERSGVPMSRSTLTDLFHKSASVLLPLSSHLLQGIRPASDVTEPIAEGRGPCSAMVASLCESGLTGRT